MITEQQKLKLFPSLYSTTTIMVEDAGCTKRSGFHLSCNGCGMLAAMVPAKPAATVWHLAAMWKPGFTVLLSKFSSPSLNWHI